MAYKKRTSKQFKALIYQFDMNGMTHSINLNAQNMNGMTRFELYGYQILYVIVIYLFQFSIASSSVLEAICF